MNKKAVLKKIVGPKGTETLRYLLQNAKYVKSVAAGCTGKIETAFPYQVFQDEGHHLFFGYYDLQQMNTDCTRMLAHRIKKGAIVGKDVAEIGWIDVSSGAFHKVAETPAWCWQQGSRLRWHPFNENWIVFNNTVDGAHITEAWDIQKGNCVMRIPRALYDIDPLFKYGLSVNFSRLQRLRPGYGYSDLPDSTVKENAPEQDGIFYVDIATGETELLVTLKELAQGINGDDQHHYINHISISPDGKRFMFFHIRTALGNSMWRTRLCVYDIADKELKCLEEELIVSHYCWKDSNKILITLVGGRYFLYDVSTMAKTELRYPELSHDGHPVYMRDSRTILTDTYPLENSMQHLFCVDEYDGQGRMIAKLYSDPRLYLEKRCDLHPRVTPDDRFVTVDSTFSGCKKSIVLFKIDGLENNICQK